MNSPNCTSTLLKTRPGGKSACTNKASYAADPAFSLTVVVGQLENSIVALVRHPPAFPCTNGSPTDSLNVDDHNEIILLLFHL